MTPCFYGLFVWFGLVLVLVLVQATGCLLLGQETDDDFGGEENIFQVWPC